jgi:shikimate kinase
MARRSLIKEIEHVRSRLGNHPIVLVGLMGAGKTTVGRRLAEKLGIPFVDADHEIELAAGKRISEIFADHGEAYFREGERKVIARLIDSGAQIMATGGGAFMNEDTRRRIRETGISVWLRADLPLLMKRVSRRSDRPLLNDDDPAIVMARLIEQRYPTYGTADITVDSRDIPHTSIVKDVIRALAEWTEWERLNDRT